MIQAGNGAVDEGRQWQLIPIDMSPTLLNNFKTAYRDMLSMDLARLDRLYTEDVQFRDPVHRVRGLPALQDYFATVVSGVEECRFEFLDQLLADEGAYFKWDMYLRHPKLAKGELVVVRGFSQIQYRDRIYYHEDSYDMGQMLYEHLPVVGAMTRWLKLRMAS